MEVIGTLIASLIALLGGHAPVATPAPTPAFTTEQPAPVHATALPSVAPKTIAPANTVAPEDRWKTWTPADLKILPADQLGVMKYYRAPEGFCFGADSAYMAAYNPTYVEDVTCDPQNPDWVATPYTDPQYAQPVS